MKYLAILDGDLVSNLELGMGLSIRVTDKHKKIHQIALKPLIKPTIVNDEGIALYLTQGHINAMREYEEKQMMDELFKRTGMIVKQVESVSCDTCIYNGDCERQRRLKETADTYCVHWMPCKEEDK